MLRKVTLVNFGAAIRSGYRNYFRLHGRASRSEFWYFVLFTLLPLCLFQVIVASARHLTLAARLIPDVLGLLIFSVFLIAILPLIAVEVRRLHDTGRSGLWVLARIVSEIVLFVFLGLAGVLELRHQPIHPVFVPIVAVSVLCFGLDILLLYFLIQPSVRGYNHYDASSY